MKLGENLKKYIFEVTKRIYQRKANLGLVDPDFDFSKEANTSFERVFDFIKDNNKACSVWFSKECEEDRITEHKFYDPVRVYKVKCIDGRKPRGFEGDADSLKTEEALIALDKVRSTGELIPRQIEICAALSDTNVEPLEISLAHFDSNDPSHSCAAMQITLSNPNEDVWNYLTDSEKNLVYKARRKGNHISNLVLLELTNSRAFTNFHNRIRLEAGVPILQRVGLVALFDTRTMGMEIREPLVKTENGALYLSDLDKIEMISSTTMALKLKANKKLPAFAKYKQNFHKMASFKEYSRALIFLTAILFDNHRSEIEVFINKYYFDLTKDQKKALIYRFFRSVAHQFLSGLAEKSDHPFSKHGERYGSVSQDADYPGKYILDYQTFRMSCPDEKTGAKRMTIASSVMDSTDVDNGGPHIFFISTALENESKENFRDVINRNTDLFRSLIKDPLIRDRIDQGNILPVGVLVFKGEVVDVVIQNHLFI